MKSIKQLIRLTLIITLFLYTSCQSKRALIVSYNVENLFDTIQNSGGLDTEFIPTGKNQYTSERYNNKLTNIAKVLSSIDEKQLPDIIGLIETENRNTIEDLINQAPLAKANYKISHFDSEDPRGIDVALLYNSNFKLLDEKPIIVYTDETKRYRARDILYVKGTFYADTLHLFVNHWKSRSGGTEKTESRRVLSAVTLRHITDSLLNRNQQSKIIIMGDFNDNPTDKSLYNALGAGKPQTDSMLINIMFPLFEKGLGSHNYRDEWSMLDNIIVSQSIIKDKKGFKSEGNGYIFSPEWICYKTKNGDWAPSRTFGGKKYFNGYSDHFPIYFYLKK